MKDSERGFNEVIDLFIAMPLEQKIYGVMFLVTWVIGGNILFMANGMRRGLPWFKALRGGNSFKHFSKWEWLVLLVLAVVSLNFANLAMMGAS